MYTPNHFSIEELVPPAVHARWGDRAWMFLDDRMLMTIDQMRDAFGPMFINTWHSERLTNAWGLRQHSGLRTIDFFTQMYGDEGEKRFHQSFSQHKYGRAFDALFRDYTAEQVRSMVREVPSAFPYLTAIEDGVSWFHGDVRNVKSLMVFNP